MKQNQSPNLFFSDIVVHAFSAGALQLGDFLLHLDKQNSDQISSKIRGLVLDSVCHYQQGPLGTALASSSNPVLQLAGYAFFLSYVYSVFYPWFLKFKRADRRLLENKNNFPILMFYCKNDIVSRAKTNDKWVKEWRKRGIEVSSQCWDKSNHVMHYAYHKEEYVTLLDNFLKKRQLLF